MGFAFALMALGFLQILSGSVIGGFWFILIGMFLQGRRGRELFANGPARSPGPTSRCGTSWRARSSRCPLEATVTQLADAFWSHHVTSFPVVDGGTVRGIASVQQVHAVTAEQRIERRVSELMRPLTEELVVGPDDSVFDALGKASRNQVGRVAVLEDSRLVGYLSLKDITHVLALRGLPDGPLRPAPAANVRHAPPDRGELRSAPIAPVDHAMPRTKIVCTIGPASRSPETLEQLIRAGMDVARLNFSHGTPAEHLEVITAVRRIAERMGRPVAILQDLAGLKIRIGEVASGAVTLEAGAPFTLTTRRVSAPEQEVSVALSAPHRRRSHPATPLLLSDGDLELEVIGTTEEDVRCRVITGGTLASRKGVNLPARSISAPTFTDKDRDDLAFGLR